MAITVADNFSYQGKKPLDGRDGFDTLAQMKAYPEASVYDGCMTYCKEDEKYYTFKGSNTVDVTTGKWREFSGGGGQTYNDFTGATSSTAGAHGLVPAPSAGDEGKVLFGSGVWGALPSVDLSVLSNEANVLSTTEKAVGQTSDGYLIYQKYIPITRKRASWVQQYSATITLTASEYNISNLGKLMCAYAFCDGWDSANGKSGVFHCGANMSPSSTDILITLLDSMGVYAVMLRYTKTTDSPLPAGVKFAGVTASGEVIYEKTVETTSPSSANAWTVIADLGVNCVICEAVGTIYPGSGAIGARSINFMGAIAYSMNYSKNGEFALFVNEGGYTNKPVIVKIRYTLAS